MIVNVLGTNYNIIIKDYNDEKLFKEQNTAGFCNGFTKEIVVCNMSTYTGYENEDPTTLLPYQKQLIRHETVHAFLNESGLMDNALSNEDSPWSRNEEMVDWLAIQGPKIFRLWEEANLL